MIFHDSPRACEQPRLLIIRGPSGSGKRTLAKNVRRLLGAGVALVSQDYLRREMVGECDGRDSITPDLPVAIVESLLDRDYGVIVEGMMRIGTYGHAMKRLADSERFDVYSVRLQIDLETAEQRHREREWSERISREDFAEGYEDYAVAPKFRDELLLDAQQPEEVLPDLVSAHVGSRMRPVPAESRAVL